jgi:hypothetical protein
MVQEEEGSYFYPFTVESIKESYLDSDSDLLSSALYFDAKCAMLNLRLERILVITALAATLKHPEFNNSGLCNCVDKLRCSCWGDSRQE